LADEIGEPTKLCEVGLNYAAISGRFRMARYLSDGFSGNAKLSSGFTLAHIMMMTGQTNFVVNLH